MADKCCGSEEKEFITTDEIKGCCGDQSEKTTETATGSCCSSHNSFQGIAVTATNASCCSSQSKSVNDKIADECCSQESVKEIEINACCSGKEDEATKDASSCCSNKVEDVPNINKTPVKDERVEYRIHGMDCPSCALTIEKGLSGLNDIQEVKVNYNTAK